MNPPRTMQQFYYISFLWFVLTFNAAAVGADPERVVHFGFTRAMFRDMNENDARAALKLYGSVLGNANNLIVPKSPAVFDRVSEIVAAFTNGTTDVASMTVQDYLEIPSHLVSVRILAASNANSYQEEYLILVHVESGITTLGDLRGRRLIINNNLRSLIASSWLEVQLAKHGFEPAARFFSRVNTTTKPTRSILPVFFRQEDACIITRSGYETMCELNPQLQKQLRVIASSPAFVPHVTCFRASIDPDTIDRMIKAAVAAQDTVNGRQILTIFQCDRIAEISPAELVSVRDLLAEQEKLRSSDPASPAKTELLTR